MHQHSKQKSKNAFKRVKLHLTFVMTNKVIINRPMLLLRHPAIENRALSMHAMWFYITYAQE